MNCGSDEMNGEYMMNSVEYFRMGSLFSEIQPDIYSLRSLIKPK